MDTQIKVSVIVPVYNAKEYLVETAEYIQNQTLKDIEIIYVDDGSTDGTRELLEQIKEKDNRVVVLHQQNSYAGVARNNGLSKARGEYVVFWDSDDIFVPEALEEMYNKCVEDKADLCICAAEHYDELNGKVYPMSTYLKGEYLPENLPFTHSEIDPYLFNFSTNVPWNKMYNRQFVLDKGILFQPIKRANDNYFVMQAYFYAKTFTVVDKVLIRYRINYGTSLTGEASDDPLCVYEAYKATYDKLSREPDFENVRQSFMNKVLRSFCYFLSKQTTLQGYETLYKHYKESVFSEWSFPDDRDFYYVEKDYNRLTALKDMDAMEFMMKEYIDAFNDVRTLKAAKKEKNEALRLKKQECKQLKADIKEIRADYHRVQKKLVSIEESTSYKLGMAITFIPRKIKNIISNGEKKK